MYSVVTYYNKINDGMYQAEINNNLFLGFFYFLNFFWGGWGNE